MASLAGKSVLVTGAGGFIGSHLTRRLVLEGASVNVFAQKKEDLWRLEDVLPEITVLRGSLGDKASLRKAVSASGPKKVFHLGAFVGQQRDQKNPQLALRTNLFGTLNLVSALEPSDYDCLLNTGTSEEYGDSPVPFREDMRPRPVSPYSASKAAATLFCTMLFETRGFPITTLRPSLTFGPAQSPSMFIPQLITSALEKKDLKTTKGEQTREFCYIDDTVNGYVLAAQAKKIAGEVINIGGGKEWRLIDVAKKILDKMKTPIKLDVGGLPYRGGEVMRLCSDISKAKNLLGWEPRVGLEAGLSKTISWYQKNYASVKKFL